MIAISLKRVIPSFKPFIEMTKPGILLGNLISTTGGFLLATKGHIALSLLLAAYIGTALIMASGCVFNNVIDHDIDQVMQRTKQRAIANHAITLSTARWYGIFLGIVGWLVLERFVNPLTAWLGIAGWFSYVVLYSAWLKRRSTYGTFIGSLAGAIPPVMGYCAVMHQLDLAAALLYLMLVTWQIPHFYAIALFRAEDYTAAGIPALPLITPQPISTLYIVLFVALFAITSPLLALLGYTSGFYLITSLLAGVIWLALALSGFCSSQQATPKKWARRLFVFSLIIILALNIAMSIDYRYTLL